MKKITEILTSTICKIVTVSSNIGTSSMTGRKISQSIRSTYRLHIVHVAFAAKITRSRQINLEGFTCIAKIKINR